MEYIKKPPPDWRKTVKPGLRISLWQQFSGSVFLIIFGGVFLYFLTPEVWHYYQARNWPSTPCTIVSANVSSHRAAGSGKTMYAAQIEYIYEVNLKQYRSRRYTFLNPSTGGSRADEIAAAYPPGSKTICFFNPDNPSLAVLNKSFTFFSLMILIPLPFFLAGLWGFIVFLKNVMVRVFTRR